jgi:hypothetical protein
MKTETSPGELSLSLKACKFGNFNGTPKFTLHPFDVSPIPTRASALKAANLQDSDG